MGSNDVEFDLNDDAIVDHLDVSIWGHDLGRSSFGDSNLDGVFNSNDLVAVFQAAEYEDDLIANSRWSTGDWNGDAEFDSRDLVLAFQDGGYDLTAQTVPESSIAGCLIAASFVFLFGHKRAAIDHVAIIEQKNRTRK